ncbi:hypothetical protein FLK61_35065 [Paenalkalicoccus suaedae]|uniref:Uncharacterized protein n=1 Tax=Paenalkalicoccus suaedae TaxID=2592382 RepID=A0A859FGE6_9BACI|nr:hypothetical protein [Paenalkalicoccus suaedae]QKS71890.1 hypothetical protein FLK61_35065 [Paenalkalicoccus suaedae]
MNVDGIRSFAFGLGVIIMIVGVLGAIGIGFFLYTVPPYSVGDMTIDEGVLHPLRWWIAGASLLSSLVFGAILMGIAAIIATLQGDTEVKEDPYQKPDYSQLKHNDIDYNPALDDSVR